MNYKIEKYKGTKTPMLNIKYRLTLIPTILIRVANGYSFLTEKHEKSLDITFEFLSWFFILSFKKV